MLVGVVFSLVALLLVWLSAILLSHRDSASTVTVVLNEIKKKKLKDEYMVDVDS